MVESAQPATARTDRRARFRKLRELLEPARDPALAIAQALYVDRSGALNQRIAAELELEPASIHLLIGGVGSGKTTELLRVADNLLTTEDIRPLFFDATVRHDIAKMRHGIIALQVGLELVALAHASSNRLHSRQHGLVRRRIRVCRLGGQSELAVEVGAPAAQLP